MAEKMILLTWEAIDAITADEWDHITTPLRSAIWSLREYTRELPRLIDEKNAALAKLAALQREADGMREALGGISEHAENQDINHLDFRIHAKRCADQALEACSPQADGVKGTT